MCCRTAVFDRCDWTMLCLSTRSGITFWHIMDSHEDTKARRDGTQFLRLRGFVSSCESDSFCGEKFTENTAIIFRNLCLKTADFQHFRAASPAPSVNFQIACQAGPENIQTAVSAAIWSRLSKSLSRAWRWTGGDIKRTVRCRTAVFGE